MYTKGLWPRLAMPIAAGLAMTLIALLGDRLARALCEPPPAITPFETGALRCHKVTSNPGWFYAPIPAVVLIVAYVTWRRPRKAVWVSLLVVVFVLVLLDLVAAQWWIESAEVGGQ